MPKSSHRLPLGAAVLALACTARHAHAFERQWHVGAGLGAASYAGAENKLGPALAAHAAYGLSDMFDARLELVASRHTNRADEAISLFSASAGIAYKLDVLEWIPYVGLLAGYYHVSGKPAPAFRNDVALSAILGLDYALSRSVALGVALRYHGLLLDAPQSLSDAAYFTGILRAEYQFGW